MLRWVNQELGGVGWGGLSKLQAQANKNTCCFFKKRKDKGGDSPFVITDCC